MELKHTKLLPDPLQENCNCEPMPYCLSTCKVPNHKSSTFVVVGSSVAAVALLVFCAYFLYVKYYKNRRSSQAQAQAQAQHQEEETLHHHHDHDHDQDEIFINEEHGPVADHPIWYIRTVGLEQSLISSISVCRYKKGEGLVEGTECAVCLSEFQEDETLRLLPKCDHAFHIPCIDTWLTSHTNCPLCRAPIIKAGAVELAPLQQLNAAAESSEAAEEELESRFEVVENIGESGNSTNAEAEDEIDDGIIRTTNEAGEHDISNKEISVNEDEARRRSVSMDSAAASKISLAVSNAVAVEKTKTSRGIEIVAKRVRGDQNLSRKNKGSSSQNGKQAIQKSSSWNGKFSICIDIHNSEAVVPLRSF